MRLKIMISLIAAWVAGPTLASTVDVAGIPVEETVRVGGVALQLNGAGVRVAFFKLYVGALYTTAKVASFKELQAVQGPKRVAITLLRETDSATFGRRLTRGLESAIDKQEMSRMVPSLVRMGELFAAIKQPLLPKDEITVDWIPGTGMIVSIKGKPQGEPFRDPEFNRVVLSLWLGPNTAGWELRDAMLDIK